MVTVYKFEIGQLMTDEYLAHIAAECRKNVDKSKVFFATLGGACLDEQQRRAMRPQDPPTEFSVPPIVDDEQAYHAACQYAVFAMQAANEQAELILRNFWGVVVEILYNQLDQGIINHATNGAGVGAHCH